MEAVKLKKNQKYHFNEKIATKEGSLYTNIQFQMPAANSKILDTTPELKAILVKLDTYIAFESPYLLATNAKIKASATLGEIQTLAVIIYTENSWGIVGQFWPSNECMAVFGNQNESYFTTDFYDAGEGALDKEDESNKVVEVIDQLKSMDDKSLELIWDELHRELEEFALKELYE